MKMDHWRSHTATPTGARALRFGFTAAGSHYFRLLLGNGLLTYVTASLYGPWARAKQIRFLRESTFLDDVPFEYHGRGGELFRGYLLVLAVGVTAYFALFMLIAVLPESLVPLIIVATLVASTFLFHYVEYRSRKYQLSRTSWRGIRFHLGGEASEYTRLAGWNLLLAVLTLGILYPRYRHQSIRFTCDHVSWGSLRFRYDGDAGEYSAIWLRGFLFTILTFGIYAFWWLPAIHNYVIDHISVGPARLRSTLEPGNLFENAFKSLLLVVFTLGIGAAWAHIWHLRLLLESTAVDAVPDLSKVLPAVDAEGTSGEAAAEALGLEIDIGL